MKKLFLVLFLGLVAGGLGSFLLSKKATLSISFNKEKEAAAELVPRNIALDRPVRWAAWQIPDHVFEDWKRINAGGPLEDPDVQRDIDDVDSVAFALKNWADIDNIPLPEFFNLDHASIKQTDAEKQTLVFNLDLSKDGAFLKRVPLILVNQQAISTFPEFCRSVLYHEMILLIGEVEDLSKMSRNNRIVSCLREQSK